MIAKLGKVLWMIIFMCLLFLAGTLLLPRVFGMSPMAVLSGSMSPKYPVGSLIYVADVGNQDLKTGDVITYRMGEKTVVTHRIVSIDKENGQIRTKGDANENEDGGVITYDQVIGKVRGCMPLLGYVAVYLGNVI